MIQKHGGNQEKKIFISYILEFLKRSTFKVNLNLKQSINYINMNYNYFSLTITKISKPLPLFT